MKKQVFVIHGGGTFRSYDEYLSYLKEYKLDFDDLKSVGWKKALEKKLGVKFEVIASRMPSSSNAKYIEWKIWFEKFFSYLKSDIILIGHSLGGTFLAKYLSENKFPVSIMATLLIAAPYDDKSTDYSLADFVLPDNLYKMQEQGGEIHIFHSMDDKVVPFSDSVKYKEGLQEAKDHIFNDRGHFNQEEFPELVTVIKDLVSK